MDLGLHGRVAWVLGGSSGLGRASASSLSSEGARVAVSARRAEPLAQAASGIEHRTGNECVAVPLDVADGDAIEPAARAVEQRLGPIDVLVANAGGPPPGSFARLSDEQMDDAVALTLRSAWLLAKAVAPGMKQRGSGCIVFITSSSTKEIIPALLLSNMLRPAVVGLAKTLSKELGGHGIRVVCAAPGTIETPRLQSLDESRAERTGRPLEDIRSAAHAGIPLGRYGRPEEFGDVVAFLASERASYVTGVSVVVDGGALHGLLS